MKRNLIYSVFAALLLASCSSNEDIPTPAPAPETLDAYLSLSVSNGAVLTKAATRADEEETEDPTYGEGTTSDPEGTTAINSFTVAVFRGESTNGLTQENAITAPVVEPEGSLVYMNTFDATTLISSNDKAAQQLCNSGIVGTKNGKDYQINGIKVKAGKLHVLIMANMPSDFPKTKPVTMASLKNEIYGDLANEGFNNTKVEGSYPCSMSSKWFEVTINPNKDEDAKDAPADKLNNRVYYLLGNGTVAKATETTQGTATSDANRTFDAYSGSAESIPLYRNVSAIGFKKITLDPSDGWGKTNGATLTLKAIFITNAVNQTSMTIGTSVEKGNNTNKVYSGGYKTPSGDNYRGNGKNAVLSKVNNKDDLPCLFKEWTSKNPTISSTNSTNYLPVNEDESCVGKYFMVYENSEAMGAGDGKHTLITLYADYSYTDNRGDAHTVKDCFYTVVVNDENNTGTGAGYGTYVGRNYIYNVNLTIVGPGSTNPFIPLYTANATAFVEAADWTGAVDINQGVE